MGRRKKAPRKPLTRSEQMARIRGANTKPERLLAKALWASGLRYRLRLKCFGVRPDIVFTKAQVAVFIDGCFWHGCPEHYVRPRTSTAFWSRKLRENVTRDQRQVALLQEAGWRVVRIWEHQVFVGIADAISTIQSVIAGYSINAQAWRVAEASPLGEDGAQETRTLVTIDRTSGERFVLHDRHTRKWKATR